MQAWREGGSRQNCLGQVHTTENSAAAPLRQVCVTPGAGTRADIKRVQSKGTGPVDSARAAGTDRPPGQWDRLSI